MPEVGPYGDAIDGPHLQTQRVSQPLCEGGGGKKLKKGNKKQGKDNEEENTRREEEEG